MAAGASALLVLGRHATAQRAYSMSVYKSPTCGCCGEWIKHMRANGFGVTVHEVEDTSPYRKRYGVPEALASCHTAVAAGYAIEGHVPAADVKRLLHKSLRVRGLAVPGMPASAPGMDQSPPEPYETIAFHDRGYWVFAKH